MIRIMIIRLLRIRLIVIRRINLDLLTMLVELGWLEMMLVQECNEKTEEVCQEVSETRCQVRLTASSITTSKYPF